MLRVCKQQPTNPFGNLLEIWNRERKILHTQHHNQLILLMFQSLRTFVNTNKGPESAGCVLEAFLCPYRV